MDGPIDTFFKDVLHLEGRSQSQVRESVRGHIEKYEKMFRAAQLDQRSKDFAVRGCRTLCRRRVWQEMTHCKGTPTEVHLQTVLSVLDGPVG
jgi:hypothetical protein